MGAYASEPGSPDWWMDRLVRKIISRQNRYDRLEAYFLGDHPLPLLSQRATLAIRKLQRMARTNYSALVTMAPVERMQVIGFKFGSTDNADTDAARIWQANELDFQSVLQHLMCSVFGDAYAIVAPPVSDMPDVPAITVEDPRYCAVEMDPSRPGRVLAGFKMWEDPVAGKILGVLYLPDSIHYYTGPGIEDVRNLDDVTLTRRLVGGGIGSLQETFAVANTLGVPPLVHFQWQAGLGEYAQGEAEGVLDIQDRINNEIMNRLIISRSQAYKQRMVTGVKLLDDGKGRKPPFDPGADMLWVVQDPNAKIFEFKEADITQLLAAVRDDVGDMAAVTKTPPHYLLGEVVNVSGDALKAAETGLVSKVRQRMRLMAPAWERVIRLSFRYMDDPRATEQVAQVLWADPESKSRAELADAMSKEISAGIPLQLAMARAGYTPEEIEFAVEEKRRSDARNIAMQYAARSQQTTTTDQRKPAESPSVGTETAGGTPDTTQNVGGK